MPMNKQGVFRNGATCYPILFLVIQGCIVKHRNLLITNPIGIALLEQFFL
jgi:hypothetical protein